MDSEVKVWSGLSRREVLKAAAIGGLGMMVAPGVFAAEAPAAARDVINVALIGGGRQGRVLMEQCFKIPGIRFKALCDIWSYSKQYTANLINKKQQARKMGDIAVYEDYRELLSKEKDLQAVIIATPDWMHAEQAIACMEAGLHVYCEKEMSNDLAKAKAMVQTSQKTGKLLQIGHQRRSNPRYQHAYNKIIVESGMLGRLNHAYGQWNRGVTPDEKVPEAYPISPETLAKYGYENGHQFRNWRWFKKYGGGPVADLGSHQIDIFSWFLQTNPKSIVASGGADYYKEHEWCDNAMIIFEFATPKGVARAFYQVLTTTSAMGYYESFMGDDGTLGMSENPSRCRVFSEGRIATDPDAKHPWQPWADKGYITRKPPDPAPPAAAGGDEMHAKILAMYGASPPPVTWLMPVPVEEGYHLAHVKNFIDAVRDSKVKLNCPGEVGYETAVTILNINKAILSGQKVEFKAEDFKV